MTKIGEQIFECLGTLQELIEMVWLSLEKRNTQFRKNISVEKCVAVTLLFVL